MVKCDSVIKVDVKAKKRRLSRRNTNAGRPAMLKEKKDNIVMAYNDGVSVAEIAKQHGISERTVYRVLKERS